MNDTLRTILELVMLPTFIVAALAFVMREVFKSFLSMDIERYRSKLQTDLEDHKAQLRAQYEVLQFEFQQRFSSMHLKESEAVVELYSLLAEIYSKYSLVMVFFRGGTTPDSFAFGVEDDIGPERKPIGDHIADAESKCEEFDNYFRKKKIFFDSEVSEQCQQVVNTVSSLSFEISRLFEIRVKKLNLNPTLISKAETLFKNLCDLELSLKTQFRQSLSASPPQFLENHRNTPKSIVKDQ